MRVKLGDKIYFCTLVTHNQYSKIILLTTSNGVYTVLMNSEEEARYSHMSLLVDGYYDFSECEYSN